MSQENVEFARRCSVVGTRGERRFPDEEIHPDIVLLDEPADVLQAAGLQE
jgi:hypothetical protein